MTLRRRFFLHCDEPGCSTRYPAAIDRRTVHTNARELRLAARLHGWTHHTDPATRQGLDLCPTHNARGTAA